MLFTAGSDRVSFFEQISAYIPAIALELGSRVLFALIVFIVGIQVIRLFRRITKKALRRGHAEEGLVQFLDSLLKALLYMVLFAMIARNFGLDATSIAALIGTAGVAVGLAVQGSLSNVAGGVLIILLKPFKVGDYIIEDKHGNEGTVSEIDLIYTKLKTLDNRIIVLPNGTLANSSLTNVTAYPERRLDIRITLAADADIIKAKEAVVGVLRADEAVLEDKECLAFVDELILGAVVLVARCWVKTEEFRPSKMRITENIKLALDNADVSIRPQYVIIKDSK